MSKENVIATVAGVVGVCVVGAVSIPMWIKRIEKRDTMKHEAEMPESYWEAKKAEAEASIEIKKLDNEKEIKLKELDNAKAIQINADKLEAEKNMPDEYFKTKQADIARVQAEHVAKIQAESNEKIANDKQKADLERDKEQNRSTEKLANELRWAVNTIRNF